MELLSLFKKKKLLYIKCTNYQTFISLGIADKRTAMSGNPLPDPRRLSLDVHSHFDNPTDYVTHMFMAWGQFLVHDITLAPQARGGKLKIFF